ncbi:hypothetical protein HMPREF1870_01645 [Bacteroidales bacterium KA00344]|nr:hypothetical protein HMPREF1870_01645 [Bacteroidales bacterium KA00344]
MMVFSCPPDCSICKIMGIIFGNNGTFQKAEAHISQSFYIFAIIYVNYE